jgi:hypothetical protein
MLKENAKKKQTNKQKQNNKTKSKHKVAIKKTNQTITTTSSSC